MRMSGGEYVVSIPFFELSLPMLNLWDQCDGRSLEGCVPEAAWAEAFFNNTENKAALGVPGHVNFSTLNMEVFEAFRDEGDL